MRGKPVESLWQTMSAEMAQCAWGCAAIRVTMTGTATLLLMLLVTES